MSESVISQTMCALPWESTTIDGLDSEVAFDPPTCVVEIKIVSTPTEICINAYRRSGVVEFSIQTK